MEILILKFIDSYNLESAVEHDIAFLRLQNSQSFPNTLPPARLRVRHLLWFIALNYATPSGLIVFINLHEL